MEFGENFQGGTYGYIAYPRSLTCPRGYGVFKKKEGKKNVVD